MKIYASSRFKTNGEDRQSFEEWVKRLESTTQRKYERINVETSLGQTHVWGLNTADATRPVLVIFPGARTTSLIWDLDKGLDNFRQSLRIFLVETNGLPNLSDGATPDIRSLDYGHWANEVLVGLNIDRAFIAGASFGGLICMKLSITHPEKVKAAFLLNPGCLQPFSLSVKNLYYNILPIVSPSQKNILKFLNNAVFCKPTHRLSDSAERLLVDYQTLALTRYQDKTQKPYYMKDQLTSVKADTYLLLGDRDILFPFEKSVANAKKYIATLKDIKIFSNVAHGIETYDKALHYVGQRIALLSER